MKIRFGRCSLKIAFPFAALFTYFLSSELCLNFLVAAVFASLHELGHIAALCVFGQMPKELVFGIMGVRIDSRTDLLSLKEECITAAAGPAVNLMFMVICYALKEKSELLKLIFIINTGLFAVNMLPLKSLDGGMILNNLCLMKFTAGITDKIMNFCEITVSLILIGIMILSLLFDFSNASFVFFTLSICIATVFEIFKTAPRRFMLRKAAYKK
ncbi:MAG: hypothetical protein LUH40_03500 [Clostridiales bacterium]|nr:hypothetical protein [Clostridiales bacterium]